MQKPLLVWHVLLKQFSAEEMYITILIEYATLALPIQNALMHAVMHVVQVKLFTAYYGVQKFPRDHLGG